jgi:hypothetical protein
MNLQEQRTALRTQLLDLSRLSQRALDYSIKGYELKNSDFSRQPACLGREMKERHNQIRILCRQLIGMGVAAPSDFRFSLAALRLNSAFYKTYRAAARIAQASTLVPGNRTISPRAALDEFGELVNRLVRLSTVALFLNDSGPAEEVLHNQAIWRRSELLLDRSHDIECDCDTLAIMQNLSVVAKQAHEMADAILFWLKGRDCALAFETEGHHALEYLIPKSALAVEKSPRPARNHMLCC